MYVRAGMRIQDLAFLGRWKSDVLQYAEEALEEMPVNSRTTSRCLEQVNNAPGTQGSRSIVPATPVFGPATPATPRGTTAAELNKSEHVDRRKETVTFESVSNVVAGPKATHCGCTLQEPRKTIECSILFHVLSGTCLSPVGKQRVAGLSQTGQEKQPSLADQTWHGENATNASRSEKSATMSTRRTRGA